jgi:DNA-binding SARP family transcriptional activator
MRALGDPWGLSLPLRHLGYVVLGQGDDARAALIIRESLALCRDLGEKWFTSMCLEDLAGIACRQGDCERAVRLLGAAEALREAIGAALRPLYRDGYERTVAMARAGLDAPAFAAAWAAGRAMTLDQAVAYALEEAVAAPPEAEPKPGLRVVAPVTSERPELRFFALGPARAQRAGAWLTAEDWGYARPRELLFYLLCHPPRSKEQIGLVFWPEATPEQVRRNLGVALHQLRRALGRPEWIVFEHERYTVNRALGCWFDVDAFETRLAAAGPLQNNGRAQETRAIRHALEEAVALYGGDFLEDIVDGEWHLPRREHLRRRYQEGLFGLGQLCMAEGQYSQAAEVYRRAIAHDPYLEAAHRELLRCYARQGERGQAVRHYRALVERMRDELGVSPAPETTALVERLRRGEAI